ncbi:MAG: PLP-dependent aminotransferase family protein [Eubacterium sp.]|nr:PLP-dependent aminotransferase family protein [Eubacterium sp.]
MPVNSFDNYPMSWKPVIDRNSETPLYIALADTLKTDILEGRLTPGTKLPPQRELADYLDIHLSTITRAFKLCEQRGLVCSVVGRGTFISSDAATKGMLTIHEATEKVIEMGAILPNPDIEETVTDYLKEMITEPDFYKLMQYAPVNYDELQIKAAIRWFSYYGLKTSKDNILFSSGSQNAIFTILSALFSPGDKIVTTNVTYPGLKVAANSLGIQVIPLPVFDNTITAESLDYVVKNHDVRGFYLIPDFNNPSGELMNIDTRHEIAEYVNKKKLPLIEDSIYSLFLPKPLPPISSFTPEHGIMIGSVSKILSPGLRLAVIHVPKQYYTEVSNTLYSIVITPPALMMQLFTRIVNLGKFDKIRELRIEEVIERNKLFDEICTGFRSSGDSSCPLRWAFIPDKRGITPSTAEKELLDKGIQIYSAERFVVGNSEIPQAVRISLISEHNLDAYKCGLKELNKYLSDIP